MDALFNRKPDSFLERFRKNPLLTITQSVHGSKPLNYSTATQDHPIRLVCISDTHNKHDGIPPLPEGDILIHAGDLTNNGSREELHSVLAWMHRQPHPHKVFIGGNHDRDLSDAEFVTYLKKTYPSLTYLQESSLTLSVKGRELKLYGSPKVPRCGNFPFQYEPLAPWNKTSTVWSDIPADTDILITHGPPFGHLDAGHGCSALLEAIWRVRPRLHVFGHIHQARGMETVGWTESQRAYENIFRKTAGWTSLPAVALGRVRRTKPPPSQRTTLLVNAAIVGGLLDNKVVNEATVVEI